MRELDFPKAVHDALKHYNDLERLEASPLAELDAILPLPAEAMAGVLASHARGLAVRGLLDQGMEQLSGTLPEAAGLLRLRFYEEVSISRISETESVVRATLHKRLNKGLAALTAIIGKRAFEAAKVQRQRLYYQTEAFPAAFRGQALVGLEHYLREMRAGLRRAVSHPSLLVVTGLGGIGKTSLTCEALQGWLKQEAPPIKKVLWATVEQQVGHEALQWGEQEAELALERLLWQLGEQLELPIAAIPNNKQRLRAIKSRLLADLERFVIVIDNVETPHEAQLALSLAEPLLPLAQVVVTSRREIEHNQAHLIHLRELSEPHALQLLHLESRRRGLLSLSDDDAQRLYQQIGGHPLALKLVAGQVGHLPVAEVLSALHNNSPLADDLYSHVYETSWNLLSG